MRNLLFLVLFDCSNPVNYGDSRVVEYDNLADYQAPVAYKSQVRSVCGDMFTDTELYWLYRDEIVVRTLDDCF